MRRNWFKDEQGYYRNCPLIMRERQQALQRFRLFRARKLAAEWDMAFRAGLIRSPSIGRRDRVVQPRPFREAYPETPQLWWLDDLPRDEP
jgi:hypothetical protein